jgi:CheY-like chemotaxis protein
MRDDLLAGRRVLIVEDEYFLAEDLRAALIDVGVEVIGPAPSVEEALALIVAAPMIDAAVLDVNLRGDLVFPVADALHARAVPFVFASGYDRGSIPTRFADVPNVRKPLQPRSIASVLHPLLRPEPC